MLITRHRDRPGMIGRIGQMLGEADVNISAMHLGRSAPRADALMILALDDDVPAGGRRGDPGPRGRHRPVDDPARERALSGRTRRPPAARPRRARCDARPRPPRRVASSSSRAASRARPRRRSRRSGGARPSASPARLAHPHASPALPVPTGPPIEIVHSPLGRDDRDRRARSAGAMAAELASGGRSRRARTRASWRSARASGRACTTPRSSAAGRDLLATWRRRPLEAWAPGGESIPDVAAASDRPLPGSSRARPRASPVQLDRRPGRGLPRAAGAASRGRSSSATTASSGSTKPNQ